MMEIEELKFIKKCQREFKEQFRKTLEIDWNTMNGVEMYSPKEEIEDVFNMCIKKHKANVDVIRNRNQRIFKKRNYNESLALRDFCKFIVENRHPISKAASLINRDRVLVYYYAEKYKYAK